MRATFTRQALDVQSGGCCKDWLWFSMPRIDHVAMWVRDVDGICAFYAEHFGAVVGERYESQVRGFASRFLSFESGARIEVMTTTALSLISDPTEGQRTGLAHLAFSLGRADAVDVLTARLRALGARVFDAQSLTGDGYYESVVLDPEGNRIELTASE